MSIPIPQEGEVLPESAWVPRLYRVVFGDDGEDNDVDVGSQATYELIDVQSEVVVLGVWGRVITAFNSSVTITIGDGDDPDGYMTSTEVAPQTAVDENLYSSLEEGTPALAGGKHYNADDTIDAVIGGADVTAGQMELFVLAFIPGTARTPSA